MSQFKDFNELADPLILPIGGKLYTIPLLGFADGVRFTAATKEGDTDAEVIDDVEFLRMFLGTAYEEMLADNVPEVAVMRAAMTALADYQRGRPTAEVMWATGGDPKVLTEYLKEKAPNRAARRSKTTAAATMTKPRASTTGTTSRKGSPTK